MCVELPNLHANHDYKDEERHRSRREGRDAIMCPLLTIPVFSCLVHLKVGVVSEAQVQEPSAQH